MRQQCSGPPYLRAVKDEALVCQCLCQVLDTLSFTRARRPSRGTSEVEAHCTRECHVAAVGERRDYKTWCVAEVLVAVREFGVVHLQRETRVASGGSPIQRKEEIASRRG
jgi:hypothetical protein